MYALRRVAFAAPRQYPLRAAPRSASWQPIARLYSSEAAAATSAAEQKPTETPVASRPSDSTPSEAKKSTSPTESKSSAAAPAGQSKTENNSESDDLTPEEEKRMNKAVNSSLSRHNRQTKANSSPYTSKPATKPPPKPVTPQTSGSTIPQQPPPRGNSKKTTPTYINQDSAPTNRGLELSAQIDWNKSYSGASLRAVSEEQYASLTEPIDVDDIEVKPDGVVYLPEIKYRRKLNDVFGPMGWALVPRGEPVVGSNIVTREYVLLAAGRFVAQAQGENNYFSADGLPSAVEGCKSNALMRCCKDLGIASELWDPRFVRHFRKQHVVEAWVEHATTKKKRAMYFRSGQVEVSYPWKRTG